MFSYGLLGDLAKIYQAERMEEARIDRLVKEVRAGKPGLRDRCLAHSGECLILIGQWLLDRYGLMEPRPTRQRTLSHELVCDC